MSSCAPLRNKIGVVGGTLMMLVSLRNMDRVSTVMRIACKEGNDISYEVNDVNSVG
jgi:hypothetical protein